MPAEFVEPTHADSIAHAEIGHVMDRRPDLSNDANTFMAETFLIMAEVFIRATDSAVRNLDDDLRRPSFAMAPGLYDVSIVGSLENCKIDTHDC